MYSYTTATHDEDVNRTAHYTGLGMEKTCKGRATKKLILIMIMIMGGGMEGISNHDMITPFVAAILRHIE